MPRRLETAAAQRAALEQVERDEAQKAMLFAASMRHRYEVAQLWASERSGFAEMELAGTALVGQIRAARELEDSVRLQEIFVQTNRLLDEGVLFVPAAELLLRETRRCTPRVQAAVDTRIAGALVGMNTTDARRLLARTILQVEAEIDPQLTQQRLDAARKDSRVWISPGPDGMTAIGAVLDAVVGRRWAVDFEQLVQAQHVLDRRDGIERSLQELRAHVFATLPTLVLELCRAARDGRLAELNEVAQLDPTAALELQQLALATADLPLPQTDEAVAVDEAVAFDGPEIRVEVDPYDPAVAALDPYAGLPTAASTGLESPDDDPEELTDPFREPPPSAWAAQDAAQDDPLWTGRLGHRPEPGVTREQLDELLLRCLRLPLTTPVTVNVHIPMATALGLSSAPGTVEGYGPLDGSQLRTLLPNADLRSVYVDETTGVPLGTTKSASRDRPADVTASLVAQLLLPVVIGDQAEPQHDPSTALAELVRLRDVRCGGPGCTMPAHRCDLDHEIRHPEGPTAAWNLNPKSRRCHGAKHHGWSVVRHDDGTQTWTSPIGRRYTSANPWASPPRLNLPAGLQIIVSTREIEIDTIHAA